MMNVVNTVLGGVRQILIERRKDARGSFNKFFSASIFRENGMEPDFCESYYTTSNKGVIRGMHFQNPPYDLAKLVTVISGDVLDVVLDLRRASMTFGCAASFNLSAGSSTSIYIPSGFAHGFAALSDCVLLYQVTAEYAPSSDVGVRWDSFGFDWMLNNPLLSNRDAGFPALSEFNSPF